MNNLVITVESGSDMPEDLAGQYGIFIVPMYVQFGDKTCADGSFPPSEVCRYFKETGKVPKTSGSSPDDYRKVFDEIHSRWPEKKILHLAYSAVTTCSFQSAQIAAASEAAREEGFREIHWMEARGVITAHGGPGAFAMAGYASTVHQK